ncbi:MAG: hypothetical protein LBK43_02390, partial [Treponema sp.]|nr:hypothetical protein [Treponema sp.]
MSTKPACGHTSMAGIVAGAASRIGGGGTSGKTPAFLTGAAGGGGTGSSSTDSAQAEKLSASSSA